MVKNAIGRLAGVGLAGRCHRLRSGVSGARFLEICPVAQRQGPKVDVEEGVL